MRASARELLVPFLTPLEWLSRDLKPQPTAPKADGLPGPAHGLCLSRSENPKDRCSFDLICKLTIIRDYFLGRFGEICSFFGKNLIEIC